jgi:hypothetical protein
VLFEPDAYTPRPAYAASNRPPEPPLPPEPPDLVRAAPPAADAPGDQCDVEAPLSAADVEAAIDAAIASNDLAAAMRLIPEIAHTTPQTQALIESKLRVKFGRNFSPRGFARGIRSVEEEMSKKHAPIVHEDEMPPADAPDLIADIPLTDSGNGERIVKLFGEDIRFCSEFKKWLLWDGRRWLVDTDALTVTQKGKNMARLLHRQAALLQDPMRRKLTQAHARDSESQAAISAALLRAKSEPGMSVSAANLDQHRYLLNCLNGVVDVRSGGLLPFERRYYITKLCHVNYNPIRTRRRTARAS